MKSKLTREPTSRKKIIIINIRGSFFVPCHLLSRCCNAYVEKFPCHRSVQYLKQEIYQEYKNVPTAMYK